MKNGVQYLEQQKVTRYAKLCALLKKWEAQKEVLREELLEGTRQGKKCPRSGPYILTVVQEERKQLSWKDEWVTLARRLFGDRWRGEQKKLEDAAPRIPVEKLIPQVNPDFRLEQPESVSARR